MKVGIITILKVNNYGAELQAYATQAVLNDMGYDAEIIDYLFYKNPYFKKERISAPSFRLPIEIRFKEWAFPKFAKIKSLFKGRKESDRSERFSNFHKNNTRLSKTYRALSDLLKSDLDYDVYLTGSDQVWNPFTYTSLAPYFLRFAPDGNPRVAYASSFGVSEIPSFAKEFYAKALNDYSAIGVREDQAVNIVKAVSGKDATLVLDPTLLMTGDSWRRLADKSEINIPDGYVLVYELIPCSYIRMLANEISKKYGLRVVRIGRSAADSEAVASVQNITDAGPIEFLWLFANASCIVTNSFHGTAFAANFNKDFYTVLPLRKKNNSRQKSLLKLLDLEYRLIVEGDPLPNLDNIHVDYAETNKILAEKRQQSKEFLRNAIEG